MGTPLSEFDLLRDLREHNAEKVFQENVDGLDSKYPHQYISHMESPEEDDRLVAEISHVVDSVFSRVPLPENPMETALQLLPDEVRGNEENEALKDIIRSKYLAKREREAAEAKRITAATKAWKQESNDEDRNQLQKRIDSLKIQLRMAESQLSGMH